MKNRWIYLLAVAVGALLVALALNVFPIPGTDSVVFIPPALSMARGQGLANPLYFVTRFTDLTHTNRFNYYVPLWPMVLGFFGRVQPGIKTVFVVSSLLSISGIAVYTRYVARHIIPFAGRWVKLLAGLSVLYLGIYFVPTVGRPEGLTTLLVMLVYLLYHQRARVHALVYNLLLCVLLGSILATQIICFYFCFLVLISAELLSSRKADSIVAVNFGRALGSIAIFCIVLQLSPNGLYHTIDGIRLHINYVLVRSDRSVAQFFYYWLVQPLNTGFLLLFLAAAVCYGRWLYKGSRGIGAVKQVLLAGVQLFLLYGIGKFILYASPTVYNATQFILPLSAFLLGSLAVLPVRQRMALVVPSGVAYLAGVLILLRTAALFADYLHDGKVYDAAKPMVNEMVEHGQHVYLTGGLWALADNLDKIKAYDKANVHPGDTIIVQQAYHPFPAELQGRCTIIKDWTTTDVRRFMGIPLTHRPQGYSFWLCRIN